MSVQNNMLWYNGSMLKTLRIIFISATLMASTVTSFAADESCKVHLEAKAECLEYLRELAEQGNMRAQFILGWMYHAGSGATQDYREAARWYQRAAEQGHVDAQAILGVMYQDGKGVTQDYRESVRWHRAAAEQGHVEAQFILGATYNEGDNVPMDKREALRWYQRAAEQGHADSQVNLGLMYRNGEGVTVDNREAVRWYRMAAEQGYAKAQVILGAMYEKGEGVTIDKREAVRWYRLAAEQGHATAQLVFGLKYYFGEGVVEDRRETYIWLLIAKASGNESAGKSLQKIPWQKHLTPADIRSAKLEAKQRFKEIENRKNSAQFSDNDSAQKSGEKFAIAKSPEETNIAAAVFENTWRSVVMVRGNTVQGSGVIVRPNLVATNCHLIESDDVTVYKSENRRINESTPFSAKVVYRKEEHDFCILEVKGLWGIAATIRKYDTLKIGENVYALGTPRGLDLSLSNGLVSQLRTNKGTRFIQTDAAISPGSSGGGLFDTKGNFIGILTSKYADENTEGIGFAIPADLALEF